MASIFFIGSMAFFLSAIYAFGFRHLSREHWQILGTIPLRKQKDGTWQGLNLTYYGLLNASSVTLAVLLVLILLSSVGLPLVITLSVVAGVLLLCAPLANLIARWVEKKKHTFTIGGAAFVGIMMSPPLLWMLHIISTHFEYPPIPLFEIMSALTVGYALGEGSGRLSCISFGCCYGKPLDSLPRRLQRIFSPFCLVYEGATKKAAYAAGLAGRKTVAVPAMTAVFYSTAALLGTYFYLNGRAKTAYLLCVMITQLWRFFSEFLRADYRGGRRISAYQIMSLLAAAAALLYFWILPATPVNADIIQGLRTLWNPLIILACQITWVVVFLYMGRSQVTAAHISLYVRSDRI
jgi:hypothetical protein